MKATDFDRMFRVNTLGTAYVTRALLPGMKAAGGGRILFTSSMAAQVRLRENDGPRNASSGWDALNELSNSIPGRSAI